MVHIPRSKIQSPQSPENKGFFSLRFGPFLGMERYLKTEYVERVCMTSKSKSTILVVDDEASIRTYLTAILGNEYDVLTAPNGKEALEIIHSTSVNMVLLDLLLKDGEEGLDILKKIKSLRDEVAVIIVSGVKMVSTVVEAIRLGASDYVNKPIVKDELFLAMERVQRQRSLEKNNAVLRAEVVDRSAKNQIIGKSPAINHVKTMVSRLKNQEVNVFLVGDTGTGKEVFARELHRQEENENRPFVSVNCAAIPENLLESVLFGHEKGSFTGATERKQGKFELADGGDIFLDEISSMPMSLQAKLLRVIEEQEVERVGGARPKKVHFRVIAAANEDIVKKVAAGEFRQDLYYRLNTVTIQLPKLNDRREDIVPLAEYFLNKYKRSEHPKHLSEEAKDALCVHDWRGNIRELRNTVENMIIFSRGDVIQETEVPFCGKDSVLSAQNATVSELEKPEDEKQAKVSPNFSSFLDQSYEEAQKAFDKQLIMKRLEKNRWSKTKTAKDLGISRNKLYRKLAEVGIGV